VTEADRQGLRRADSFRMRLRDATREAHFATERLAGEMRDLQSYRAYLSAMWIFRSAYEQALAALEWPHLFGSWRPLVLAADIQADSRDLELSCFLPAAAAIAPGYGTMLGTCYVMEGASLGARAICRRVETFGCDASFGARHLRAQASATENWRAFLAILDSCPDEEKRQAEAAALSTFAHAGICFSRA
jgi:heme oxygenase (biliverdin-IX-beta and delta-forming)